MAVPVTMTFFYRDGTSDAITEQVRIFRPLLEIDKSPASITLSNANEGKACIPIALKFSGFGEISIEARCTIEGRIVSVGSSLLDEIVRKILKGGAACIAPDARSGATASSDRAGLLVKQIRGMLQASGRISGTAGTLCADSDEARMLRSMDAETKKKIASALYDTVEAYMAEAVADIPGRNMGNNLQINPAKIQAMITLPVTRVAIELLYRDLAGNEYEPVRKIVDVIDRRARSGGVAVEIPLTISSVDESSAYKNVRAMKIGDGE